MEENQDEYEVGLKNIFDFFDKDGNETIDVNELTDLMRAIGQNKTEEEVGVIIAEAGFEDRVTFDQFKALVPTIAQSSEEQRKMLKEAFSVYDTTKDDKIDMDELKRILVHLGQEAVSDEDFETQKTAFEDIIGEDNKIPIDDLVEMFVVGDAWIKDFKKN